MVRTMCFLVGYRFHNFMRPVLRIPYAHSLTAKEIREKARASATVAGVFLAFLVALLGALVAAEGKDIIERIKPASLGLAITGILGALLPYLTLREERKISAAQWEAQAWRETGGPILPIEFSRVSSDCRLTLVIDPTHGVPVVTRYVQSPRASLDDAIGDLCQREGTAKKGVGFTGPRETSCRVEALCLAIRQWKEKHGFEGIVWTDLASNFEEETGLAFSLEEAKSYLVHLPKSAADRARQYVNNAPPEVDTPLRRTLQQAGWL